MYKKSRTLSLLQSDKFCESDLYLILREVGHPEYYRVLDWLGSGKKSRQQVEEELSGKG
jgi:hypothetical protein